MASRPCVEGVLKLAAEDALVHLNSHIHPSVLVMVMSMLSSCIFVTGWKNSSCDPISV